MTSHPTETVSTTINIPVRLRVELDEVRLNRARRDRSLAPKLNQVIREALELFIAHERRAP